MYRKLFLILLALVLSLHAVTIEQIDTAKEAAVKNGIVEYDKRTAIFQPTDPAFHLVAQYSHAKPNETIQVEWYAVDAVSQPDYLIATQSFTLSEPQGGIHAYLSRGDKPWPVGNYKAVLRGEKGVLTTVLFAVASDQKSDTTPTPPSPEAQYMLVGTTVHYLLEGLNAKDFSKLYHHAAQALKDIASLAEFNQGLMPLTEMDVDWNRLLKQKPTIERGGIDEENLMHLFVRYPGIDGKPDFHLHLVYKKEGELWKIAGIWVE